MVVRMSRRIGVNLFEALRPDLAADTVKVVITGSAEEGAEWA